MFDLSSITAAPWHLVLVLFMLCSSSELEASAFSRPRTNSVNCHHASSTGITQRLLASQPLFASSNNDDADSLLEKARRLRQDVSVVESSKMKRQKEEDAKEVERQAAEREVQMQKDKRRMRYSAEVPILKDMGEEVMERVDFPPRLKGGKFRIGYTCSYKEVCIHDC